MQNTQRWNLSWTHLAVLVPLVGAGWLEPWWLPWMLVLVGLFLQRFHPEHLHLYGSLPVVAALLPAALLYPDPLRMSGAFLVAAFSGWLLVRLSHNILQGSLPSLVGLALLWAAFPSMMGTVGLFCAALARSEKNTMNSRPGRIPLLMAGVLIMLIPLTTLLPAPPTRWLAQQLNFRIWQPESLNQPAEPSGVEASEAPAGPDAQNAPASRNTMPRITGLWGVQQLVLFSFLLLFTVGLLLMGNVSSKRHRSLSDLLLMLALLSVLAAAVVYSQLYNRKSASGEGAVVEDRFRPPEHLQPEPKELAAPPEPADLPAKPEQNNAGFPWWPFLIPVGLAGWILWKARSGRQSARQEPAQHRAHLLPAQVTLQGVRKLYHDFLDLMATQGLGRLPSNTPKEYAVQIGVQHPEMRGWVEAITAAYLPVRYGDLPDQNSFEQAHTALMHLQKHFQKGTP
ncbi:DUF4129 domain-containing protein [Deinococcus roseus]|uniref:Protein-glutamine gamma-glutamyltransferase-like C-terminal domain-containing protein n=1 Tax=Deinococcus roseus TaxID=392414 RepID=A0ABQ2CYP7_9DEIO|nr:DUF4129 domain-containing protein [Deinococcus roseus]GGJ34034.1 hypothetical protein GCM10008938_20290 [Deinococcus roseus]